MKVVNIFGLVVAVHVVVLVLIFAIPGCRTSSKSPDRQMTSAVEPAPASVTFPSASAQAPSRDLSADLNPPLAPRSASGFDTTAASGGRQSPTRPGSGGTITAAPLPTAAPEVTYTVVRGDSLWSVAKKHGITVRELATANNLRTEASLQLNQVLKIPSRAPDAVSAPAVAGLTLPSSAHGAASGPSGSGEAITYEVRAGDTLGAIARRHNTTVNAIKAFNQRRNDMVRVGEKLLIPQGTAATASVSAPVAAPVATTVAAPAASTARAGGGAMKHVVAPGETLGQVARRYGIDLGALAEANNIPDPTKIRPGQELILPGVSAPAGSAARPAEPIRYTPSYQPGTPTTPPPANPPSIRSGDRDNVPVIRVEEPEQTIRLEPAPSGGGDPQPPLFN
jgi:LysM repeat protein